MAHPGNQHNPQSLERKLATILSADVAEFSRLMAEDEEGTLKIFSSHKQVFESLVAMHRGRIFNTAGDAILAEFGSAVEAVRCGTDIQAALRTANDQLSPARQVKFRIGINLGDVMIHGQDLLGDGVNVAARLQSAAEPGGICISGSVHDQIVNKLSLSFQSLGEMSFKNIQHPVRTFSITEVEGEVELPRRKKRGMEILWTRMVAPGVLLAASGLGIYFYMDHCKAENARLTPAVTEPEVSSSGALAAAVSGIENPNVSTAETAAPETSSSDPAVSSSAAGQSARDRVPQKDASTVAEAGAGGTADPKEFSGKYSGSICYAQTKKAPQLCYHAEGKIQDAIISGEWLVGPAKKVRAMMAGRVMKSGGVRIEIQTRNADDDTKLALITMHGTLRAGLINATGSFRNGRPVTLSWHKNPETAH